MANPGHAELFGRLWDELTGEAIEPGQVSITGDESVLPGPFRVAAAAAASVMAANFAAAELLRAKGVDPGVVTVDTRHAAAAFRSERLLRIDGESPGDLFAPLSADYRAADGWVRLHCNYPHHAVAASRALGAPAERAALEAAALSRRASDVQEAVIAAGGAAAAMRTREEWHAHPQGTVLRELPLVDLRRLGSTAPIPLPPGGRPLSGIKVLELTHVIAGPVCGRVLAAHGADVLHVGASHLPLVGPLVVDTGFGKRSAAVDLRDGEGRARLRELVREADVFVQSYRPGSLAAKGFGADMLAEASPGIVAVDLSAYGWQGPWAGRRGFDSLVQLASGIADEGAREAGTEGPRPLPAQALDHATGWLAAAAVMTALRRRTKDGGAWRARLSLARTGLWLDSLGRLDTDDTDDTDGLHEPQDPDDLLDEIGSPFGRVTYIRMPGSLPAAPPHWSHGPHVPGSDPAAWW